MSPPHSPESQGRAGPAGDKLTTHSPGAPPAPGARQVWSPFPRAQGPGDTPPIRAAPPGGCFLARQRRAGGLLAAPGAARTAPLPLPLLTGDTDGFQHGAPSGSAAALLCRLPPARRTPDCWAGSQRPATRDVPTSLRQRIRVVRLAPDRQAGAPPVELPPVRLPASADYKSRRAPRGPSAGGGGARARCTLGSVVHLSVFRGTTPPTPRGNRGIPPALLVPYVSSIWRL